MTDTPKKIGTRAEHELIIEEWYDVDHPDKAATWLRKVADECRESARECEQAWQDKAAGRPWWRLARIIDRAADRAERSAAKP